MNFHLNYTQSAHAIQSNCKRFLLIPFLVFNYHTFTTVILQIHVKHTYPHIDTHTQLVHCYNNDVLNHPNYQFHVHQFSNNFELFYYDSFYFVFMKLFILNEAKNEHIFIDYFYIFNKNHHMKIKIRILF